MVIAAGIAAAGTAGSAAVQSRAAGRAAKGQQKSTSQAMRVEQQREAEARRRYDQQWADYQKRRDEYDARRRMILRKHGIDVPEPASPAQVSTGGVGAPTRFTPGQTDVGMQKLPPGGGGFTPGQTDVGMGKPPGRTFNGGMTLGQLAQGGQLKPVAPTDTDSGALVPPTGATLGDLANWSDWRRYNA